jgi:hypothetical protein
MIIVFEAIFPALFLHKVFGHSIITQGFQKDFLPLSLSLFIYIYIYIYIYIVT